MRYSVRRWILVLVLWACSAVPAWADNWPLPKTEVYQSSNGRLEFRVVPKDWPAEDGNPVGTLSHVGKGDKAGMIWQRALVNPVAPVRALVTDAGDYVVTFDNWHSMGYGDQVVVIYDGRGGMVASLGLDELMPRELVETLPRSFSSIRWGGKHQFDDDGKAVLLEVAVPRWKRTDEEARYFRIRVDLASGRARIVRDMDWTQALAASARMREVLDQQRSEHQGAVTAPAIQSELAWRRYAREVFFRRAPDWQVASFESQIVNLPPHRQAISDLRTLRGMLGYSRLPASRWVLVSRGQGRGNHTTFVLASAAPQVLADALTSEAAKLPAGVLTGWQVIVVCEPRDVGRLRIALERLGANFIAVDPAEPLPQRPERTRSEQ